MVAQHYSDAAAMGARERGLTNGWLHSTAESTRSPALGEARIALDASLTRLGVAAGGAVDVPVAVRMTELARQRTAADSRSESPPRVFDWYTGLIAALIDGSARRLANGMIEVGLPYEHVTHLLQASEILAQTRGKVNGVLLADAMPDDVTAEVIRLTSLYAEYLRLYQRAAPGPVLTDTVKQLQSPALQLAASRVAQLIQTREPASLGIDAGQWWQETTSAIDLLRAVAQNQAQQLVAAADSKMDELERQMKLFAFALGLLGLVTLGLSLATVGRIVTGLSRLLSGLDTVSQGGDFRTRINYGRSDEFGAISSEVNKLIAVAADVVEAREKESLTDPLTGLLNRRGFDLRLAKHFDSARARPLPSSVLLLDVDHFKRINDEFGHPGGDRVLRVLGTLLTQQVRPDDCVARFGGEEFVLLLDNCDAADAARVAEMLRERVAAHDFALGRPVTISLGVSEWRSGKDFAQVIADADAALYRAKQSGRNRVERAG